MDCTSNPAAVITGISITAAPVVLSSSTYSYMSTLAIISSDSSLQLDYFSESIVSSITIVKSTIIVDDHGAFEKSDKIFVTSGKYNTIMPVCYFLYYIYYIYI